VNAPQRSIEQGIETYQWKCFKHRGGELPGFVARSVSIGVGGRKRTLTSRGKKEGSQRPLAKTEEGGGV